MSRHLVSFCAKFDVPLCLLAGFVLVINVPYLDKEFMVGHDTKNIFLTFHYFYNHLTWNGELPRWLPFGEYGYSTLFYQISNLSPSNYLVGLMGWIAGIKDTLLLFKISVLTEQLIFLFGLHLVSQRLYKHVHTAWVVSLLGCGSVIWYWQLYWDLRLYYLLPLALYFYYRFIEEHLPWALWACLLTGLFSLVGGLAYWAPILFFLFAVLSMSLLPFSWRSVRCLAKPGWRGALLMLLFISCSASLAYVLSTCLEGLHNYSPGRASGGMRTQLSTYLTYASPPLWGQLHAFLDGMRPNTEYYGGIANPLRPLPDRFYPDDLTLYVGLLPIVGLLTGVFRVRDKWFYCLCSGMVATVLLAATGASSWLLYHLIPGFDMFRHLSLLLEIAKIFLLLAGGFGIDFLFGRVQDCRWLKEHFSLFHLLALLAVLLLVFDSAVSINVHKAESWISATELARLLPTGGAWIALRLLAWAAVLGWIFLMSRTGRWTPSFSPKILKTVVLCACVIDIAGFQGYYLARRTIGPYAGKLPLETMHFAEERVIPPSEGAIQKEMIINSSPYGAFHGYYANVLGYDPCVPCGLVDIFPRGVHELATARGAVISQENINETLIPGNDSRLKTVLGCEAPKIRFLSRAVFGSTDQELRNLIHSATELDRVAVIRGAPAERPERASSLFSSKASYTVQFFNANQLDLQVTTPPGEDGWLVYADAYDKRWKATVNGQEAPIREAYMAFKGIRLPAGSSRVCFRYHDARQELAMGWLMLTGMLLAACLLGCLGLRMTMNRRRMQSAL